MAGEIKFSTPGPRSSKAHETHHEGEIKPDVESSEMPHSSLGLQRAEQAEENVNTDANVNTEDNVNTDQTGRRSRRFEELPV
jgi:hypothetical protein